MDPTVVSRLLLIASHPLPSSASPPSRCYPLAPRRCWLHDARRRYRIPPTPVFSEDLKAIITRCLCIHPADRPTAACVVAYTEALAVRLCVSHCHSACRSNCCPPGRLHRPGRHSLCMVCSVCHASGRCTERSLTLCTAGCYMCTRLARQVRRCRRCLDPAGNVRWSGRHRRRHRHRHEQRLPLHPQRRRLRRPYSHHPLLLLREYPVFGSPPLFFTHTHLSLAHTCPHSLIPRTHPLTYPPGTTPAQSPASRHSAISSRTACV
jgi:hypothetical protein